MCSSDLHALSALQVDSLATAVLLHLAPADGDGDGWTLTWSTAGHLPPLLVHADGVDVLGPEDGDLMLGVDPTTPRSDRTRRVAPGDTLLLYSDGLVERAGEHIDDGLLRLRACVEAEAAHAGGTPDPDALVDAVLARLLPGTVCDDVAVLAVRIEGHGG